MTIKRQIVSVLELRAIKKVLKRREVFHFPGHNTVYVPSENLKYIVDGKAMEWPDLDGEVELRTDGEIARIELAREFPNITRVGWKRPHTLLLDWRWPMMFSEPYKGPLVYTDLVGAYWQIYSRLWLNTKWPCGFGTYDLAGLADRVKDHKGVRNAVMGVIRSKDSYGWKGREVIKMQPKNRFLAPELWATIQAILHDIAQLAVDTGAIYVATDGYIHKSEGNAILFQTLLDSCGLKFRTQFDPEGDVRGWGSYKVAGPDGKVTGHYLNGLRGGKTFHAVMPYNHDGKFLDFWAFRTPNYRRFKSNAKKKK